MITIFETYCCGEKHYNMFGLSTDVKPIEGITNASTFTEMDTNKSFWLDAENKAWLPKASGGGGSAVSYPIAEEASF